MASKKKGKQCPGGYWIPRNKNCGKVGNRSVAGSPKEESIEELQRQFSRKPNHQATTAAILGLASGAILANVERDIRESKDRISASLGETADRGKDGSPKVVSLEDRRRKKRGGGSRADKQDRVDGGVFFDMYPRWDSDLGGWSQEGGRWRHD